MDGLIIKKEWLDLILSGKKTLEIRGSNTRKIGEAIYLLESDSHRVRGICKINATYPISCSTWYEKKDNHCVDISYEELKKRYKNPHAWELTEVEQIEDIWFYEHPKGAVIWVKNIEPIDEMQNERIRYGY